MKKLTTAIDDIKYMVDLGGFKDTYKAKEALSILTAFHLGAQTFARHIQHFQDRWEIGDYTEEDQMHVAQLTCAFVKFMQALEDPGEGEKDPLLWLGVIALGEHAPSDLFKPAVEEPELSRAINAKYGPVEEYRWCKHGFLHAIDCEEGCTREDCRTEWPRASEASGE